MNFLFVLLGIVTAFDSDFLLNPREFVASIQNADPKVINELLDYAQQLIDEGEVVRGQVIQADNEAADAAQMAANNLDAASLDLTKKEKVEGEKLNWLIAKQDELADAVATLKAAKGHLDDSQSKFDQADATMNSELARIQSEDIDLKEVRELLLTLLPKVIELSLGRNLLETVDATIDPTGVQTVIGLVDQLLADGVKEGEHYTKLRNDAKDVLDAAVIDHSNKQTVHSHAVGAESVAQDMLETAKGDVKAAQGVKQDAEDEKNLKDAAAASAKKHREDEEKRINGEKSDFEEIIDLLRKI